MKRLPILMMITFFFCFPGIIFANDLTTKEEVWITHNSFLGSQLSLPSSYRETPMGMIANRGEVQSFIDQKDLDRIRPYFVLNHYFKDKDTPTENTSSYFADPQNVSSYYDAFLKDYYEWGARQTLQIFPKFSSNVLVLKNEHVLGIHVDSSPQEKRSYYTWAHPEGFFVIVAIYKNDSDNEFIEKVISSFQLPAKELTSS